MKTIFALGLIMMMGISVSCNRDEQDIQREEEMNREDISEESYDQDDINSGSGPSNIEGPTDFVEDEVSEE